VNRNPYEISGKETKWREFRKVGPEMRRCGSYRQKNSPGHKPLGADIYHGHQRMEESIKLTACAVFLSLGELKTDVVPKHRVVKSTRAQRQLPTVRLDQQTLNPFGVLYNSNKGTHFHLLDDLELQVSSALLGMSEYYIHYKTGASIFVELLHNNFVTI